MQVEINHQPTKIQSPGKVTVSTMLEELQLFETKGMAVAVNQQIISRSDWNEFPLSENDSITLIQATQGG